MTANDLAYTASLSSDAPRLDMPRVLSLGGGLDSFAMLLAALQRDERPDVVVFIDVGHPDDPGEWPGTYRHIREVVQPICQREGIEFVVIDHQRYPVRDQRSLFAWMQSRRQIPVAGPTRICTRIAKVERFEAWLAHRFGSTPVEVWIGFEAGEERRADKDPNAGRARQRHNRFPLIEWGLCRCRCEQLVQQLGYPVPRKSACVFCPYGTLTDWRTFASELPEQFDRVAQLEADKPVTSRGKKLSIMGWNRASQTGTPLHDYVLKTPRPRPATCSVCGAVRATKAVGCGWLTDDSHQNI